MTSIAPQRLSEFDVAFGTSGARGFVNSFSAHYCWTFTRAFLSILKPQAKGLIIGHDLRPSSPLIALRCMAAARAAGLSCIYAGAVPTPAVAFAAQVWHMPALMVTGSHIPADRNGIKAYRPEGEISKSDERAMLIAEIPPFPGPLSIDNPATDPAVLDLYIARYKSFFAADALAGLRIGVYEHSTVARDLFHTVLRCLGAETIALGRSEVFVPVDTEAIRPEDRALTRGWANEWGVDAIVSADGDADRPLLADESGEWLRGDVMGVLCAQVLGAASVVTPINSSTVLEAIGAFRNIIRTRIGSPHVIAAMTACVSEPPVVGYEANGGFLLGSDVIEEGKKLEALPTRDALLPILLMLRLARRSGVALSSTSLSLPQRFTHSDRIPDSSPEAIARLMILLERDPALLVAAFAPDSGALHSIDRTDGLRATFENRDIVHLRASGNAPELRCYTEASSRPQAEALCAACLTRAVRFL